MIPVVIGPNRRPWMIASSAVTTSLPMMGVAPAALPARGARLTSSRRSGETKLPSLRVKVPDCCSGVRGSLPSACSLARIESSPVLRARAMACRVAGSSTGEATSS